MMKIWSRYLSENGANAAAEFALVAPAFFVLVFAVINLSTAVYAYTQLHNATEDAARCYSVSTSNIATINGASVNYGETTCNSATNAQTYASNHYKGPGPTPTFTAINTGPCYVNSSGSYAGHQVSASGSFTVSAVLVKFKIPFTTDACFP
jgi:Flp pilus assembly protein TadG